MASVLGLDLGPNSIGWALIDDEAGKIIGTGVRIFEEGLNRKGAQEESKNATRRAARQARKMNARRKNRLKRLSYILTDLSMFPGSKNEEAAFFQIDPYKVRAEGLHRKLTLFELGRAFYHLNQRRGYKSNRKTDKENDKSVIYEGKDGKIGINETTQAIVTGGFQTLGEYLNAADPHETRRRNRYTTRAMYLDEFNKLWNHQAQYYPNILTEDAKPDIFDAIFYQRPLKSQKHTVATCTFEPQKRVAPKSSLVFQEFRILEQLSRLRILHPERENPKLSPSEHEFLVSELWKRENWKLDAIRKKLHLPEDTVMNLASQDKLFGHITNARIAKVFGDGWYNLSSDEQWYIWHTLHFYNDPPNRPNWLENYARENWGLDAETAGKVPKITLESGYGQLSQKAMQRIIPYLKPLPSGDILTYDKAVVLAGVENAFGQRWMELTEEEQEDIRGVVTGILVKEKMQEVKVREYLADAWNLKEDNLSKLYHHSHVITYDGSRQRLPLPEDLRNPIVQQTLHEVRKVVNAIIQTYGKPETVRVELARESRWPKWKRMGVEKLNRKREKESGEIKKRLIDENITRNPSRDDVIKYKLWEECNKECPYTGKKISLSSLYNGEFEIEHIIPYSRSLDDSIANKTLCYRAENQKKHNKTPFEAYGHDDIRYTQILERVKRFKPVDSVVQVNHEISMIKSRPNTKIKKFMQEELDDDFIARQLVDTAYISRKVKEYMSYVCKDVQVLPGRLTSTLRHLWGLDRILNPDGNQKVRDDHRHHAVDALVIANTKHGFVQALSRFDSTGRGAHRLQFPQPWKHFFEDCQSAIQEILVSHRVNNRPRGQLHEDTFYGLIELSDGERTYVVRKNLPDLTGKQTRNIVDPVVRDQVIRRLIDMGWDGKNNALPKEAFNEPLYIPNGKREIKKVRIKIPTSNMLALDEDKKRYVEYGKNHHMEIFEDQKGKRHFRVISLFEAAQRYKTGLPVINVTPPQPNWRFLMSLARNEMVLTDSDKTASIGAVELNQPDSASIHNRLYRLQLMDVNGILKFRHHSVSGADGAEGRSFARPGTLKGRKVFISVLGHLEEGEDD
ncbi:MAG: type II CRISPR RNA-guided endonuclease Cas9 [Candidatus Marinimicrobia bacterium]|nr:type II CRISPR RNA-guided endonuclease Cas9 [Candidatus Neomarinimicrobiota bacterium]